MKATKRNKALALLLALAMVLSCLSLGVFASAAEGKTYGSLTTVIPDVVVSGSGVVQGGYTAQNTGYEVAYTVDELKAIANADTQAAANNRYLYSTINSTGTKSIFLGEGVRVDTLLAKSGVTDLANAAVAFVSSDGYAATYSAAKNGPIDLTRYYYPGIATDDPAGAVEVPVTLNWAQGGERGNTTPPTEVKALDYLVNMSGQPAIDNVNNSLFNKGVGSVRVGDALTDTVLTVDGTAYTRAQVLAMERATAQYPDSSSGTGTGQPQAMGVPVASLLAKYADKADRYAVHFVTADGSVVAGDGMTLAALTSGDFLLAYATGKRTDTQLSAVYNNDAADSTASFFNLYGRLEGGNVISTKIIGITVEDTQPDYTDSNYKHINYEGAPYNMDAITGATLTVEGPGVTTSTPILVRDIEKTANENLHRTAYTDTRNGVVTTLNYEGVRVSAIMSGLVNEQVQPIDENVELVFKNRWRQDVARLSYQDIKNAQTPVLLAYGTGTVDNATVAPFVYDNELGIVQSLGNADGCLKLVLDQAEFPGAYLTGEKFSSVAYIYVETGSTTPGYKHVDATDEAYKNVANTQQLLTFTGSALGREVNYTVAELEAMVEYDASTGQPAASGMGFRKDYSLSNTTYWYVNTYEGVKLWDMLTQKLGISATDFENDQNTLVSFASWDNYKTTAEFSMYQLAHPEIFYYYEKSPLDIGTSRPTKEQLALKEYQPDNLLGDGWVKDSNGYPVKVEYPVVLAYGVNGYPYVQNKTMEGYYGGLGNDGGPVKIIYGKTDNMNRANPEATENYAYFYNNGSNQLQRAQEIYVGDDTRYSTHLENPAYESMKDTADALTVEVVSNGTTTTKSFTLGELEEVLYGESKRDMDNLGIQEKGYYNYRLKNGSAGQDLFEGVNIEYLLKEAVGLSGSLGTVSFYAAGETTPKVQVSLADLATTGYNSVRGTEGLGSMIAFAKNGYPMVLDKSAAGYVSTDSVTGFTVKNDGGPLVYVRAQTAQERDANQVSADGVVQNLNRIVVNLEADKYAHTGEVYGAYAAQTIDFTGAVTGDKVTLSAGTLETLQKYMVTDTYTVNGETRTYRGINLCKILTDSKVVGASAMMDAITVKNAAGDETTLTVADLTGANKTILLGYGIGNPAEGDVADGLPLVPTETSAGYDASYGNAGGVMRLIVDNGTCIANVAEIVVSKAAGDSWTHSYGAYEAYKNNTIEITGSNIKNPGTYTVAQLEAMSNIVLRDTYSMGGAYVMEGLDLYKLLQTIGFVDGITSSPVSVVCAKDGYAVNFNASDLENGVNGKPLLLAYGQGTTNTNGLPLVDADTSPGYDPNIGNAFGPLRLVANDNTGWSNKWVSKIVVGSETPTPTPTADFTIAGWTAGDMEYSIKDIKSITTGQGGKVEASYTYTSGGASITDAVKGIYMKDLFEAAGITDPTVTFDITTTDNTGNAAYKNITLADVAAQNYFLAYDVNGGKVADVKDDLTATVRIYRNFDDGSTWKNCLTQVTGVNITSAPDPVTVLDPPFTIWQEGQADISYQIGGTGGIKRIETGQGGKAQATYSYTKSDVAYTETVQGIYLADLLAYSGITDQNATITVKATDGFSKDHYQNISMAEIASMGYLLAYDAPVGTAVADVDKNNVQASFRIYRNYNDGSDWKNCLTNISGIQVTIPAPEYVFDTDLGTGQAGELPLAGVRSIDFDSAGGMWVGTYGGGLAYKAADSDAYTVYNTKSTPALKTNFTSAVAVDSEDGVWFSQNASYVDPTGNAGVGYLKDGVITWYDTSSAPGTIPNNYVQAIDIDEMGNVWFGSFGGITCYDPAADVWTTWDTQDGLPAMSVNTIVCDDFGGRWIGCYPDTDPDTGDMTGGYAYMDADDNIKAYTLTSPYDPALGSATLADVWVRGIACDGQGGAWIVRSGSYSYLANVGGRIDHVDGDGNVTNYTGQQLLGDRLVNNAEIRAVAVDDAGGVWFGTSGNGLFYSKYAGAVVGEFDSENGGWISAVGVDNIYSLTFAGEALCVGTMGGAHCADVSEIIADPDDGILKGDVNFDAQITAADALLALRISVGSYVPTPAQKKAAKVSTSATEQIAAMDALMILQKAVGNNPW